MGGLAWARVGPLDASAISNVLAVLPALYKSVPFNPVTGLRSWLTSRRNETPLLPMEEVVRIAPAQNEPELIG